MIFKQTHTTGPYTSSPEPGMTLVANFDLGAFVMAPQDSIKGDPQATADFFAAAANKAGGKLFVPDAYVETAMALWEAVLECRSDFEDFFAAHGTCEVRRQAAELIPAIEAAWAVIGSDYEEAWDWELLPIVVDLWAKSDFDHTVVTAEKIIAAVKQEG